MKQCIAVYFILTAVVFGLFAQDADEFYDDHFGAVSLQINDQAAQAYIAERVNLFESVDVDYDTTVQVKNQDKIDFYYYPQLRQGSNHVLHVLLAPEQDTSLASYDIFIDLGEDLPAEAIVDFTNSDSTIFFLKNGNFTREKFYSSSHTGAYSLQRASSGKGIAGNIQSTFTMPTADATSESVRLNGDLRIPIKNLKIGKQTGISDAQPSKSSVIKNITYAAIGGILIAVAFLGL